MGAVLVRRPVARFPLLNFPMEVSPMKITRADCSERDVSTVEFMTFLRDFYVPGDDGHLR